MRTLYYTLIMVSGFMLNAQNHQLKPLPYAYDALEPYMDAKTMEIHYTKHHQGYFDKFMLAAEGDEFLKSASMEQIFARINEFQPAVRNNAGGYWNHEFFWESMAPGGTEIPDGPLKDHLMKQYGSMEKFFEEFKKSAMAVFGSGWTWLVLRQGEILIENTINQDNPLMGISEGQVVPLLALDLWEHAYYLHYQNKRMEYVKSFWAIINWKEVAKRYETLNP